MNLPPLPESTVLRQCLALLQYRGVFAWRNNTVGRVEGRYLRCMKGAPDIIGILPGGRFLGVECKSARGRVSPEQREFRARCEKAGGVYILARSIHELEETLAHNPKVFS